MMISWWLPKFTHRLKVASRLATWKGMGGTSCCGFDCLRLLLHFRSENYGWELHKPWTWMCLGFECDEMESENAWETHSSRPLSIRCSSLWIDGPFVPCEVVHWTALRWAARVTKPSWTEWFLTLAALALLMDFLPFFPCACYGHLWTILSAWTRKWLMSCPKLGFQSPPPS